VFGLLGLLFWQVDNKQSLCDSARSSWMQPITSASTMSPEGSEGLKGGATQERPLHGSLSPAAFYAATSPPSKDPSPHRPSLLRNISTPGPPAATPVPPSTFSVVLGAPPLKSPASNRSEGPPTAIKKRGRPFKNPQGIPNTQSMPKTQGAPKPQSIPKKRGRPFKKPEAAAATVAAASSEDMPKKRGRPFKYPLVPEHVVRVVPPEPKFVPFVCEWKKCPAELHNLDTLRAHLYTVHLKKQSSGGPLLCLWRKCCQEHEVMDEKTGASTIVDKGAKFKTKEEWQNHVEVAHLDPIAWHQGDGPKVALGEPLPTIPRSFCPILTNARLRSKTTTRLLLPLRRERSASHTFTYESARGRGTS
jgi:hypothetical protein